MADEAEVRHQAGMPVSSSKGEPLSPDLVELLKLVGVALGGGPDPVDPKTWAETKARRQIQKQRSAHQIHALQVVRRCIGLIRGLASLNPGDAGWQETTSEIDDFYAGFRHGARADVTNRRLLVRAIERAAEMALRWRVIRAMARTRVGLATDDDRRLLRRDQAPFAAAVRETLGVEHANSLSPERAADFLTPRTVDEFFPEREWAFLVSNEATKLLLPDVAGALLAHGDKVVALLRAWTQRAGGQRAGADKWTLAAELFGLIGFANVEPETLRQDIAVGNAERKHRTEFHRSVGTKSP